MRQQVGGALGGDGLEGIMGGGSFKDAAPGPGYEVDEHQRRAAESVAFGNNTFITGGAGTGKSFTLMFILGMLEDRYGDEYNNKVGVTASTGVASILIDGCTLHTLCGVGVPVEVSDFKKIRREPFANIWKTMDVLVVDEISMVSGEFLDRLDEQLRMLRNCDKAFGGLQVVFVGDPFQLPPVEWNVGLFPINVDQEMLRENRVVFGPRKERELFTNRGKFFESESYWQAEFHKVELQVSHRQSHDSEFYDTLKQLRLVGRRAGKSRIAKKFNKRCNKVAECDQGFTLVPKKELMNTINYQKLQELKSRARTFQAIDTVHVSPRLAPEYHEIIEQHLRDESPFLDADTGVIPDAVTLKVGARVMLVANMIDIHPRLVNGALGTVTEVPLRGNWVEVEFDGVCTQKVPCHQFSFKYPTMGTCFREQIPLILSWAMTHHKVQGKTISKASVHPEAFAEGQLYVALSRTKSFDDLHLLQKCTGRDIMVDPQAGLFMDHHDDREELRKTLQTWKQQDLPREFRYVIEALEKKRDVFEHGWD